MIYNMNIACMVLGCLMSNPSLCFSPKYPISKQDFEPCRFHQIVYIGIARLAQNGAQTIGEIELDNCIKVNKAAYETWQDNKGLEFVDVTKSLANLENYEVYYSKLRKLSLVRELEERGFDITGYYEGEIDKTDSYSVADIINDFEAKTSALRTKYDTHYVREEMYAGEDTEGLIAEFEKAPLFGALMASPYQTTLYRGWCRGHLLLRSAMAGLGKTRLAVSDLVTVGAKSLWSEEQGDFVDNPNYQGSTFFIHTEMLTRENINPIFLSAISGVDNSKIIDGKLTKAEKSRVIKAGEILLDSRIRLIDMPDFTSKGLERKIKECVEQDGAAYGVFDYCQLNSALSVEYKQSMGTSVRPDMAIASLVKDLKFYAELYNVGIMSMSQLNDHWKEVEFCDAACLAGAKSMQDKLDGGSVVINAQSKLKSFKRIEPFLKKKGFGADSLQAPNIVEHIYKSRYGNKGDERLKIWSYIDRATMRRKDFFVTNERDELVKVDRTVIDTDF